MNFIKLIGGNAFFFLVMACSVPQESISYTAYFNKVKFHDVVHVTKDNARMSGIHCDTWSESANISKAVWNMVAGNDEIKSVSDLKIYYTIQLIFIIPFTWQGVWKGCYQVTGYNESKTNKIY